MKINQKIKSRRQELGMSVEDMARFARLSIAQCIDVEAYEDEFVSTLMLTEAKRLCGAIKLDIAEVLGLDKACGPVTFRKSTLIRDSRMRLGISPSVFADHIGFDECVVSEMEGDDAYFDKWPVELIIKVAEYLKMPPSILVE